MKFVYKDQVQRFLLVIFLLFFCLIAIKAHDLTVVKGQIKDSKEILFAGYVAGSTKAILQSKNGYQQGSARFIESQNGNNNAQ